MKNPYPDVEDDGTGWKVKSQRHDYWQEGHDAKEEEDQELYEALKAVEKMFGVASFEEDIRWHVYAGDTHKFLELSYQVTKAIAKVEK